MNLRDPDTVAQLRLFRASDDYHLHYRHWKPADPTPRGFVAVLHGIQSHSGWYEYSSQRLADSGYDVRFLDRRGSGLNTCRRGHTPHYARLINDVRQFLDEIRHERDCVAPQAPVVLSAVSWGGKVAAASAALFPDRLDGLALLYPGLCTKVRANVYQKGRLKLALATGKGERRIGVPLDDPELFTGEAVWQEFIRNDPQALHMVSLAFVQAGLDLEQIVSSRASEVAAPLLVMLAGRDRIVDNDRTRRLFRRFGSREKTLIEYPQARHTLEFEPNRDEIFSEVIGWLNRLSASCCQE